MDNQLAPFNLETFSGGVSSAVSPDLLPQNQTAWGLNADFRGIKVHTRPNFEQRLYLPSGLIQGAGVFSLQGGMLIAVIAGVPYRVRIGGKTSEFLFELIPLPWYNSPVVKQVWMCQTTDYLVIQDGQSRPIIYDGSSARRAGANEVPTGRMMAYGNGRLWVAVGSNLLAGDIHTASPGSELLFTETTYLSGGGAIAFSSDITGLSFIPTTGTSDLGALVVAGRNYIETVRADVTNRDSWASYPGFVTNAMRNVGVASGWSMTPVNQDLMWRDTLGGIRSLNTSMGAAYYAQYRGAQADANVPISREVSRLTEFDSQQLLNFCSGVYFNNRLLMTSSPFINTQGGVSHRDLIALDFAPVSTMQGQSPPAYNGTWQGVDWTKLVSGEFNRQVRAFGLSSDLDGVNRLWEFETDSLEDISYTDGTATGGGTILTDGTAFGIEGFIEYPRVDFGEPKRRKRLARCDVWLSNISGEVQLEVYWRPDNTQKWTKWDSTAQCAIMTDPATATPHVWKNLLPEQRPLVKSFSIPDTIDEVTTYALSVGAGFQIRLAWKGSLRIERTVLWATHVDDTDYVIREGQDGTCIANDVTGNTIRYEIPLGGSLPEPSFILDTSGIDALISSYNYNRAGVYSSYQPDFEIFGGISLWGVVGTTRTELHFWGAGSFTIGDDLDFKAFIPTGGGDFFFSLMALGFSGGAVFEFPVKSVIVTQQGGVVEALFPGQSTVAPSIFFTEERLTDSAVVGIENTFGGLTIPSDQSSVLVSLSQQLVYPPPYVPLFALDTSGASGILSGYNANHVFPSTFDPLTPATYNYYHPSGFNNTYTLSITGVALWENTSGTARTLLRYIDAIYFPISGIVDLTPYIPSVGGNLFIDVICGGPTSHIEIPITAVIESQVGGIVTGIFANINSVSPYVRTIKSTYTYDYTPASPTYGQRIYDSTVVETENTFGGVVVPSVTPTMRLNLSLAQRLILPPV